MLSRALLQGLVTEQKHPVIVSPNYSRTKLQVALTVYNVMTLDQSILTPVSSKFEALPVLARY